MPDIEGMDKTPLTLADLDDIRADCRRQVNKRAAMSGVVAALPIPMVDAAADLGLLMRLLPKISAEFALTPQEIERLDPESRAVVYTTIKSLGDSFVGKFVTQRMLMAVLARMGGKVASKSVAKYAPVVGQATAASISFWLMRHIGHKHVDDCYKVARARAEARLFGEDAVVIEGDMVRVHRD
jgi:uncharacterized protein (DUF697 family)